MVELVVVDDKNKIIGYNHKIDDNFFRVSGLFIVNQYGEILLSKRSFKKLHHPGKWGPSVEGKHLKGDDFVSRAIKSLYTELGITKSSIFPISEIILTGTYRHFHQWFQLNVIKENIKFNLNIDEIDEIKWFSKDEILNEIKSNNKNFIITQEEIDLIKY